MIEVLQHYFDREQEEVLRYRPHEQGVINQTWFIDTTKNSYVLQKINHNVFPDPTTIFFNHQLIQGYLEKNLPPQFKVLELVPTLGESLWHQDRSRHYWRMTKKVSPCISHNQLDSSHLAEQTGAAFAHFHLALHSLDHRQLRLTIENFHHTPKRLQKLFRTASKSTRSDQCTLELEKLEELAPLASRLQEEIEQKKIPLRAVHNDTKINNLLFHPETDEAIAIVDLDTVMPGILAYDFGDMVRTSCVLQSEESLAPEIELDLKLLTPLVQSYLQTLKPILSQAERDSLTLGPITIVIELAARFLTDFLEGDHYFKTDPDRPQHNLERAQNQLRLVQTLQSHQDLLWDLVATS